MSIMDELKSLEREIKEAEKQLHTSEGRLESIKDTLKEMGVSVDKADSVLKRMEEDMADLMVKITGKYEKLKETYEW